MYVSLLVVTQRESASPSPNFAESTTRTDCRTLENRLTHNADNSGEGSTMEGEI